MHRVLLDAQVQQADIEGGFEALVTGRGRTADAIHRMVSAHGRLMDQKGDLDVSLRTLPAVMIRVRVSRCG